MELPYGCTAHSLIGGVCLPELLVAAEDDGDVDAVPDVILIDVVGNKEALVRVGVDPSGQFIRARIIANEFSKAGEISPRPA